MGSNDAIKETKLNPKNARKGRKLPRNVRSVKLKDRERKNLSKTRNMAVE